MQVLLLSLLFLLLFSGIALGIPVMFALLGASFLSVAIGLLSGLVDPGLLNALPLRLYGVMDNQILLSVPLFILMGKMLEHSDLASRALLTIASAIRGSQRSSIAMSVICVSVLIACSSGVVGATITMLAAIALPAMASAKIPDKLSAGLIVAAGSLGQIIPPSIVLILLSDQISAAYQSAQREIGNFSPEPVTIGHLFAGAMVPGLILAAAYSLYALISLMGSADSSDISPDKQSRPIDWIGLAAMLTLMSVPFSILFGVATPTEAAAIGVLLLFVLIITNGKTEKLHKMGAQTVELTGVIFGIILAATVFSLAIRSFDGDILIEQAFSALPEGQFWAVLTVMIIVFLLGFILEFIEITYVVIPITAPALFAIGVDPIWFAILIALNLQISFLTPPMGVSLFYYKSVAAISSHDLIRAVVPFIMIQIIVMFLVAFFAPVATWLPAILV